MEPIASRLLLAFIFISGQAVSSLADEMDLEARNREPALPAFVPPSGSTTFKTAVSDNSPSAIAARRAAEALGAKFSEITTSSISPGAPSQGSAAQAPKPSMPLPSAQAEDPPHTIMLKGDARSIVLSSRHADDPEPEKEPTKTMSSKPKNMRRKISVSAPQGLAVRSGVAPVNANTTLAAIGQKVSFVELLSNPALWHWPSSMSNAANDTNDTHASR